MVTIVVAPGQMPGGFLPSPKADFLPDLVKLVPWLVLSRSPAPVGSRLFGLTQTWGLREKFLETVEILGKRLGTTDAALGRCWLLRIRETFCFWNDERFLALAPSSSLWGRHIHSLDRDQFFLKLSY
jgi:hypothetical protein